MSTAAKFRFKQPFPSCITDLSGAGYSYIDNLTLAQVMPFGWNLEFLSLSMNGSATKGAASVTATGAINTNPTSADQYTEGYGGGLWLPTVASATSWASWPGPLEPRQRVCKNAGGAQVTCLNFIGDLASAPSTNFFDILILIGTDPGNAGKYRIYYRFVIIVQNSSGGDSVGIAFTDPSSSAFAFPQSWQSGTIGIGGFSFSWASSYTNGASTSGTGIMTESELFYTY